MLARHRRAGLAAFVFALASVVNPAWLSGCARFDFDYGESDVLALLATASQGGPRRAESEGHTFDVSFTLSQAKTDVPFSRNEPVLVRNAEACSQRTFVRSAAACIDSTTVPVEGTLTVTDSTGVRVVDAAPVHGSFRASGRTLLHSSLELRSGTTAVRLEAEDGKTLSVSALVLNWHP